MTHRSFNRPINRSRQRGALTMISAVLILILLTELIFYAVQVGVFEQRKSANELDQKQAFHTADSAVQLAKQFFAANSTLVSSNVIDQRADGTDGWLSADDLRWQPCEGITDETHPCFGEPVDAFRDGSYFYSFEGDFNLPLDPDSYSASGNETVTMHALLCMLEIDRNADPIVQGCTTEAALQDRRYFMVTLLTRGQADCDANGANCLAEALIAEKIGSFGPGASDGGPGAPLTSRTNVPLSGTVEIVPNPNGGGVGVPISSWVNANTVDSPAPHNSCVLQEPPISPESGSYATCEAHEWYGVDIRPTNYMCPTQNCSCERGKERMLTYAQGQDREMGPDIVIDDEFPCDLWQEFFGRTWQEVKDMVPQDHVLTNCDSLNENSEGLYWVSGTDCKLQDQIGGPKNAVFLISAAADTSVSAGADIFGALMVTDKEVPAAKFTGNGHATIYGAAIMDGDMKNFNGTFQIVWVDTLVGLAFDTPLFGSIAGGWTDFHARWR